MSTFGFIRSLFNAKQQHPSPSSGEPLSGEAFVRSYRTTILRSSASMCEVKPGEKIPKVFGVLTEWFMDGQLAIVVADWTGFAGLVTPSTYKILGGPGHESGRAAAESFVCAAKDHCDEAVPTTEFPHPESGRVRFHILCKDGVRVIDADAGALEDETIGYGDLWAACQRVLKELRSVGENEKS